MRTHLTPYASILMAAAVGPLTVLLVYLDNHPQLNAAWFYLVGVGMLVCSFMTVRAFPFTPGRPQRMLLRFYLVVCLLIELAAFNFYEPHIPVLREAIVVASLAMTLYCGYRPGLGTLFRGRASEDAGDKK